MIQESYVKGPGGGGQRHGAAEAMVVRGTEAAEAMVVRGTGATEAMVDRGTGAAEVAETTRYHEKVEVVSRDWDKGQGKRTD